MRAACAQQVLRLARLALAAGADGLVCGGEEVAMLRDAFGPDPVLVVPGIRLADTPADDSGAGDHAACSDDSGRKFHCRGPADHHGGQPRRRGRRDPDGTRPIARVKICGVNSPAAMDAAVAAGADWIGFVFAANSARHVTIAQAATLSARHGGGPLRVGLFVNPSEAEIAATLGTLPLDVLQIYAAPARTAELRAVFGVAVWRALGVVTQANLPHAAEAIDGYVLDAPTIDKASPGGTGNGFDHTLLEGWRRAASLAAGRRVDDPNRPPLPSFATGATAVDVSSGVESARGVKSPELIARFVSRAHAAQAPSKR